MFRRSYTFLLIPAAGLVIGAVSALIGGCTATCDTASATSCGPGNYCLDGTCRQDCLVNEDCRSGDNCPDGDSICKTALCHSSGRCIPNTNAGTAGGGDGNPTPEGWEAPPLDADFFIVDNLQIAPGDVGFNIDGRCRGPNACTDNLAGRLGSAANPQIEAGLRGGATLLLASVAGLNANFTNRDNDVTVKFYTGKDSDNDLNNNFSGGADCCRFCLIESSLANGQSSARAGGAIQNSDLRTIGVFTLRFKLAFGSAQVEQLDLFNTRVRFNLQPDGISNGLMGGAIPAFSLGGIANPYCTTLGGPEFCPSGSGRMDSTLLDVIVQFAQPDIDLDGDGLETISVGPDQRIVSCHAANGAAIAPLIGDRPESCVFAPDMADGYSIAFTFEAVPARVGEICQQ